MKSIKNILLSVLLFALISPNLADVSQSQSDHQFIIKTDHFGVELVYVPEGEFQLGINEKHLLRICLAYELQLQREIGCENDIDRNGFEQVKMLDFWIDRYEVTNEQYDLCIQSEVCTPIYLYETFADIENIRPKQPIVGADWYQANDFCAWRWARLPTEAEWEYAASGPENYALPWGGYIVEHVTRFLGSSQDVGSVPRDISWVGAYDMAYNVEEWVEDRDMPYPSLRDTHFDRFHADYWRVVRGGSWSGAWTDAFTYLRAGLEADTHSVNTGFRCARFSEPN